MNRIDILPSMASFTRPFHTCQRKFRVPFPKPKLSTAYLELWCLGRADLSLHCVPSQPRVVLRTTPQPPYASNLVPARLIIDVMSIGATTPCISDDELCAATPGRRRAIYILVGTAWSTYRQAQAFATVRQQHI